MTPMQKQKLSRLIRRDVVSISEAMFIVLAYIFVRKDRNDITLTIDPVYGVLNGKAQKLAYACEGASVWLIQNGY